MGFASRMSVRRSVYFQSSSRSVGNAAVDSRRVTARARGDARPREVPTDRTTKVALEKPRVLRQNRPALIHLILRISNTKLRLEEGAELLGSDNISDYPLIPSRMEGRKLDYYAALINAYRVDSFSINGPGRINGNGLRYWKQFWAYRDSMKRMKLEATNLDVHRPRLLFIWGCKNVLFRNVKMCNAGFWTTHLYQCKNVLIDHCDIRSPYKPRAAPMRVSPRK